MTNTLMFYKGSDIYEYFHLTVNIINLEEKVKDKLPSMHPYKAKQFEMENELTNRGLNIGDFIDIDKEAKKYIAKHR